MSSLNVGICACSLSTLNPKVSGFPQPKSFVKTNVQSQSIPTVFSLSMDFSKLLTNKSMNKFFCSSSVSSPSSSIDLSEQEKSFAPVKLTYLEGNSWLWEIGGNIILVDPILVGPLDFGIPWLYTAYKKVLKKISLDDIPHIDYVLITQSLDDHCHLNTLRPLSQKFPDVKVISTPNAKDLISELFKNISFLSPGESISLSSESNSKPDSLSVKKSQIKVKAVAGPVLGPPWQNPENGYIVSLFEPEISVFLEPHCQPGKSVEQENADVVITPVIKQMLPYFTLVSGQEDAIDLAKNLNAKYIVPMCNGELDATGVLSALVKEVGTIEKFQELMSKEIPNCKLLNPYPGKPLSIPPQ